MIRMRPYSGFRGPSSATSCANAKSVEGVRQAFCAAVLLLSALASQQRMSAAVFSDAAPLITARGSQTATLLSNGKLLVTGGETNIGFTSAAAEVYDPV